ncbi:MAG TPA: Dyp-type peroxidase [Solirubrobacterales bacterium]
MNGAGAPGPEEPLLEVDEIQGNVLPGFMKPTLALCALQIEDAQLAKAWIREIAGAITALSETLESRKRVRALRTYEPLAEGTLGAVPEQVDDAWANISFSCTGLEKLLAGGAYEGDLERFEDPGFRAGMAARSSLLGDPTDPNAEGNAANWIVGGPDEEIDVLLCIGADNAARGQQLMEDLRGTPEGSGMVTVYQQEGEKLDQIGSEQFGFQDGVSQPGVRGLTAPGEYLTPRPIASSAIPESWIYGLPGQLLTWPGDYVFGYPSSGPDPRLPGPLATVGPQAPDWTRNGSYFVFRRFRQDVAGFWAFLAEQAEELSQRQPGFAGWDAERLGAAVVGRWKSGAPLARSPEADDPSLGTNRLANNDFGFAAPSVQLPLEGGGTTPPFPLAQGDPIGATCPMAAHIRKVNARTAGDDMGGRQPSFQRRILRRGLPWGPKLENPEEPDPAEGQRGLLFLSYQASIARQFEFLSNSWMGSDTNPRSPSGFDLLVGQNGEPGQGGKRHAILFGKNFEVGEVVANDIFVIPTGGGYYFTPSISALREVISA